MNELSLDDIKTIALDGLKCFISICKKYNLRYYLGSGSLIGAVRHNGFIPWDDDIDVFMPRDDYKRLEQIKHEITEPNWNLLSYSSNPKYGHIWKKLCNTKTKVIPSRFTSGLIYGVSIDIFPLDFLKSSDLDNAVCEKNFYLDRLKKARKLNHVQNTLTDGVISDIKRFYKRMRYNISCLTGQFNLSQSYEAIENEIMKVKNGDYLAYMFDVIYSPSKTIWKKEWFYTDTEECAYLTFEDIKVRVPLKYKEVLTTTYGDYMQMPPKEKQVTHHSYHAFYIK